MKHNYLVSKSVILVVMFSIIGFSSCKSNEEKKEKMAEQEESVQKEAPFFKLSLAQWSIHKAIKNGNISPLDFAQKAKEYGFDAVEYVSQLYTNELKKDSNPIIAMQNLLDTLKMKSEKYGVKNINIMIDNEGNLAAADETERNLAVEHHKKWIDAGVFLGCYTVRVNLKGSDDVDIWSKKSIMSLKQLAEYAKPKNINVIVEKSWRLFF